jgi:hypothetical protein
MAREDGHREDDEPREDEKATSSAKTRREGQPNVGTGVRMSWGAMSCGRAEMTTRKLLKKNHVRDASETT